MKKSERIDYAVSMLEKGKAGPADALKIIMTPHAPRRGPNRSRGLRIWIKDSGKKRFRLRLPIGLLIMSGGLLNRIAGFVLKKKLGKKEMKFLKNVDFKKMAKMLQKTPPCGIVDVQDGNKKVLIELVK